MNKNMETPYWDQLTRSAQEVNNLLLFISQHTLCRTSTINAKRWFIFCLMNIPCLAFVKNATHSPGTPK